MISQISQTRRIAAEASNPPYSSSQVKASLFQHNSALVEYASIAAIVQQQLALVSAVPAKQSLAGSSVEQRNPSLKLAALMPEEQLNKMSDVEIKALFQTTQDSKLKSQLGTEAGARRKLGAITQAQSSNDQTKSNFTTQQAQASNQTKPHATAQTQLAVNPAKFNAVPPQTSPTHPKIGVVVSLDDMNGDVVPVLESFKRLSIPVDLMPLNPKFMEGSSAQIASNLALITENLQKAKELGLNSRQGVHGDKAGILDKEPLQGTNTSSAAWPSGKDGTEARSNAPYVTQDSVIRGVSCEVNKWGEFNQHNLKSCSISNRPEDQKWLGKATDAVIQNGGVLSMHLHNKQGLANFEETVKRLQASGADFMFLEDLKGKGATVKK